MMLLFFKRDLPDRLAIFALRISSSGSGSIPPFYHHDVGMGLLRSFSSLCTYRREAPSGCVPRIFDHLLCTFLPRLAHSAIE